MADNLAQQIDDVARMLVAARRVAAMTGAGISAESGVPTFRGAGGLWCGYRVEEVATPQAFARDPELVWRFYAERRKNLIGIKPNPAHHALVELERLCPRFDLITQNVDGLHTDAGSRNLIALHGDIWIDRCTHCGHEERATGVPKGVPKCEGCGGALRPGVVWFGEMLPPGAMERAVEAAAAADVMFVVGTSSVVQPAASLAGVASHAGATVVEVNIECTPLSGAADVSLCGPAGTVMPRVVAGLRELRES